MRNRGGIVVIKLPIKLLNRVVLFWRVQLEGLLRGVEECSETGIVEQKRRCVRCFLNVKQDNYCMQMDLLSASTFDY